jgi:hypothetical protein
MNLNPTYTAVTAKGGVIVTECCGSGFTVLLTLHSAKPSQVIFSNRLPLAQDGCTAAYTWADYTFQHVQSPEDTSYPAIITAQAFNCEGTTCGSSQSIAIVITK